MQLSRAHRLIVAAAFLFVSVPAQLAAQATPIASGSIILDQSGGKRTLAFTAVKLPDGSVTGQGEFNLRRVGIRLHFALTSVFVDPLGNVILAGPITHSQGTGAPPVGFTAFFALRRIGGVVEMTGISAAPPAFPTAAAIFAVIGSPPSAAFFPQGSGRLTLH